MDKIKDPLGVVARWKQEAEPHPPSGWDDVIYGWGIPLLAVGFAAGIGVLLWSLFA